ncbi:hypothetical protein MEQU1_003101 [Malassezia equina]|uniref:U3 small nucleolar RNA-associated protein 14 n=1 Tax=Malassezia equina TaxID=1381935 RepID=A0AAF0EGW8_9BASI|nr:hypothetical protein MEQU1_003101 [Malassezia equina]
MVRRSKKPRQDARTAPARPPAPAWDDDEEDMGPRGPRVFDDSDDEPEGIVGDDEEIDSDEAFGEDDDWALPASKKNVESEEESEEGPSDFEDDDGEDIVALSNLLDEASDEDDAHAPADDPSSDAYEDEEGFEGFDDEMAALYSRKRSRADGDDQPRKRQERTEAVQEGTDAAGGTTKLRLEDLMALGKGSSMSKVQVLAEAPSSDGRRPIASKRGGGVLQAPLPKIVQDRLDRSAAYKLSKEEVQGWAPTIKRLREAEHLSFPLQPAAQPPAASNAGLASKFKPTTDMERSVAALLEEGGLTEKQMAEEEGLAMKALDPDEALRRQTELRRMRELMFRAEQKARRANKIKSKTYRRIHRKERERMQQQMAELTAAEGGLDDEEREELMYKAAKDRAKERATLRHKNTGKWAKLHVGRHDDASREATLALEEQLRRGDELRKRIHTYDDDDDVSLDEDDTEDRRAAAFDELADFEQKEAERDAREEAELEASNKKGKGLLNMKFMKDARERQSKAAKETIQSLKDALAQEQGDQSDSDADQSVDVDVHPIGPTAGRAVYHSAATRENDTQAPAERPANPFKTGQSNPWLADAEDGPKSSPVSSMPSGKGDTAAARSQHRTERHVQRGQEARASAMDDATLAIDPHAQMQAAEASAESDSDEEPREVTKTSRGKRGRGKKRTSTMPSMQRDLVSEAFAGDNVALDFVKEKRALVEAEAPKEEDTALPGWGSWGGKGVRRKSQKNPNLIKKVAGIDPRNRKDYGMDRVIVNEKLDKKASKYKAKDLPFPYTSAAQYEAAMRTPIGAEWNTRTQHQRLTLPRVTTKMGQRIDPIRAY